MQWKHFVPEYKADQNPVLLRSTVFSCYSPAMEQLWEGAGPAQAQQSPQAAIYSHAPTGNRAAMVPVKEQTLPTSLVTSTLLSLAHGTLNARSCSKKSQHKGSLFNQTTTTSITTTF